MTTVSNNAELMSALSMAVGGETIELTAGDYGSLSLRNMMFPSDVTLVSADPANPAIVHDIYVRDSSHLVFDGILFDYVYTDGDRTTAKPFEVLASAFITFRNSVFSGVEIPSESGSGDYGTGFGLWVTNSDNVVIENNEFFNFWKALTVQLAVNVVVAHNDVHSLRSDGFNFIGVDGLLVEGNWIHDFKRDPSTGDHADMIQFWTVAGKPASQNVIIRGNFLDAGTGDYTQALFINTIKGVFQDFLIEHNIIYADHVHGITVSETDGLTIRNNTLLHDPHTISPKGWSPKINMNVLSVNVVVEDNITADVANFPVGNNLLVQFDDPNGENYYGDLFVNPFAVDATLADLRAKAGGLIETGGYGAVMTRADLPLVVGPYAVAPPPAPGVCEALLAEALAVIEVYVVDIENLKGQLTAAEAALATMTGERDVALASLASMTTLWGEAVDALVAAQGALVDMTVERDAALSKLASIHMTSAP